MDPSPISCSRAAYHYFSSDVRHLLLTGIVACFLGKHVLVRLGKNVNSFLWMDRIEHIAKQSFMLYEIPGMVESAESLYAFFVRSGDDVREEKKGDFPRKDNQYHIRILLKPSSLCLKLFACCVSLKKTGEALGILSSTTGKQIILYSVGSSLLSVLFDIYERECMRQDLNLDVDRDTTQQLNNVPICLKLKHPDNTESKKVYVKTIQKKRVYDQGYAVVKAVQKTITLIPLLYAQRSRTLEGRCCIAGHLSNINGALNTIMLLIDFANHIHCGATMQQLEKGNVLKKDKV